MIVDITPSAESDIRVAFDWYRGRAEGLGFEFEEAVHEALNFVLAFPHAGPVHEEPVRRIQVTSFPFSIYYLVETGRIIAVAVMHDRRDPRGLKR
jgi:plasmid stabilization system protein ParE